MLKFFYRRFRLTFQGVTMSLTYTTALVTNSFLKDSSGNPSLPGFCHHKTCRFQLADKYTML